MKKRLTLLLTAIALVSGASAQSAGSPATAAATTPSLTADSKNRLIETIGMRLRTIAFVPGKDFSSFPQAVEKARERLDKAQTTTEFAGIINEILNTYGVSHMAVITPEAARARQTGGTVGFGIQLEIVEKGIRILNVFQGSPADKAGIRAGDHIVRVNGAKPTSRAALDGPPEAIFELEVLSPDGKLRTAKVQRAFFSTREPETLRWQGDVAILRIPTFDGVMGMNSGQQPVGYSGPAVRQFMSEIQPRAKALVIDFRGNPGGVVANMLGFTGYFLPGGTRMGAFVNRTLSQRFVQETGKKPDDLKAFIEWSPSFVRPIPQSVRYNGPIAVLVNGGTGSAAEMASAALRDHAGARIFGQKSVGMVLASMILPLDQPGLPAEQRTGFQMILPMQDYITMNGLRIEGSGVKPDVELPIPAPNAADTVMEAAVKWATEQAAKKAN